MSSKDSENGWQRPGTAYQESRMAEVEGRIPEHPVAAWGLQLPGPLPRTSW